jgi:hypothetical protein
MNITWSSGWRPISDEAYERRLIEELRKEIENNPKHILFGKRVDFIAEWLGTREKDFLVCLADGSYATVHLTYNLERDPNWPWTNLIGDYTKVQDFIDHFAEDFELDES